jgi:23S rRNA maturation-related 3'-5' exoribonuclease YhaM
MSDTSVNERFDGVHKSIERVTQSLDRVTQSIERLTQYVIDMGEETKSRLLAIENRLDFLSLTVTSIDSRLSALTKAHARNRVFSLSIGAGMIET